VWSSYLKNQPKRASLVVTNILSLNDTCNFSK
jgi:hypothetical protein